MKSALCETDSSLVLRSSQCVFVCFHVLVSLKRLTVKVMIKRYTNLRVLCKDSTSIHFSISHQHLLNL